MSTVSSSQRASRRQSQDGSVDNVVVNLDASSPVVGSRRGVSTSSAGARTSPIDLEALEDEVLAVSPSQVPPQRRNRRTRRQSVIARKSNNAPKTSKEPAKVAPKEPIFTCAVWNKLEEPSTTICGHIFCTNCIKQAIQVQKKCPTCRKSLKKNNFHRIYLPNSVG